MGTKKRGSELIFNLEWKNIPENGGDKSNLIGMYDTQATTLNFITFKSYLLKNSGVAGNDIKVTYLTQSGPEWTIHNQGEFQIALCAFRLKARLGEVIHLRLEKMSGGTGAHRKISTDAETQIGDNANETSPRENEGPPEWFLNYMVQFKRDMVEEVTFAVSSNIIATTQKEKEHHPSFKRTKPESSKRSRKHVAMGDAPVDKDLLKTLKYDRKLEIKLDKLDAKTKKIKEKKQTLIAGAKHYELKPLLTPSDAENCSTLGAALINNKTNVIPHLMPGDIYLHSWDVVNSGNLPWTSKTELRLTWGSADMKPFTKVIRCPPLNPGENATISVRFVIPDNPGQYESYWNFFDGETRFGNWLSCCVIVDASPVCHMRTLQNKKPKIDVDEGIFLPKLNCTSTPERKPSNPMLAMFEDSFAIVQAPDESETKEAAVVQNNAIDLSKRKMMKAMHDSAIEDCNEFGCSNKYGIDENELIVDLSNCRISDFGETEKDFKMDGPEDGELNLKPSQDDNNNVNNRAGSVDNNTSESISEIGSVASEASSGYDVISDPICEEKDEGGYVYITIDGNKLPVPKHVLRPDFVANAEKVPEPVILDQDENKKEPEKEENEIPKAAAAAAATSITTTANNNADCSSDDLFREINREAAKLQAELLNLEHNVQDTKSFMSHCSTAGTCFSDVNGQSMANSRLFIFPQNNPGYEVVSSQSKPEEIKIENTGLQKIDRIVVYPEGVEKKPDGSAPDAVEFYPQGNERMEPQKIIFFPHGVNCPTNTVEVLPTDPMQTYTWARSQTQYTLADMQNTSPSALKYDPYGPLDNSRPTSSSHAGAGNATKFEHIPNYQQSSFKTAPRAGVPQQNQNPSCPRAAPSAPPSQASSASPSSQSVPVHILPENLVSGAVNVASSAINTARSVINMIVPPKSEPAGSWVNGHFVIKNPESFRAKNLRILSEMGFWDTDLNATLLARYNDDMTRVVSELVQ